MNYTREQFVIDVLCLFIGYFIGFGVAKMRR